MIFLKCFSYRSHPLSSSPSCSLFFSCFYFLFLPFLPFLHIKLRTIRGKSVFWKLWINSESDLWLSTGSVCCCSVAKLCPSLCDLMACSPPGFSVHGISRGRILEWVVISFSRGSSWSKDRTCVSCIGRQILYHWVTGKQHSRIRGCKCKYVQGQTMCIVTASHVKPQGFAKLALSSMRISLKYVNMCLMYLRMWCSHWAESFQALLWFSQS